MRRFFGRLFTSLPGWFALILVLGGTALATAPVFNGSINLPNGATITGSGTENLTPSGLATAIASPAPYNYNSLTINGDQISDNQNGAAAVSGFSVVHKFGGGNTAGSRQAGYFELDLTGSSAAGNLDHDYVAIQAHPDGQVNDGGTSGSPTGQLFGFSSSVALESAATNWFEAVGIENDMNVLTGASVKYRFGANMISSGGAQATLSGAQDAAYVVSAGSSPQPSWHNGLLFGNIAGGPPIDSTGCLICTDGHANTVGTGLDLSAYTISGNAWNFQHGHMDGLGNIVIDGTLGIGAGKKLYSQSGNLEIDGGSGSSIAVNYGTGSANSVSFYDGTTGVLQTLNSSGLTFASAQTIATSSGALSLNSAAGSNINVNYNTGAGMAFYHGGTTLQALINGNGVQTTIPAKTCSASSYLPCTFNWSVSLSAATSSTTTQQVPASSVCTLTPTSSLMVSSSNMATYYESLSTNTLTITVQAQAAATQSFSGVGECR